jgi:hypothetical protein
VNYLPRLALNSLSFFITSTNPVMKEEPSQPKHLPLGPTSQHLQWGLHFQHMPFGEHIQTTAPTHTTSWPGTSIPSSWTVQPSVFLQASRPVLAEST